MDLTSEQRENYVNAMAEAQFKVTRFTTMEYQDALTIGTAFIAYAVGSAKRDNRPLHPDMIPLITKAFEEDPAAFTSAYLAGLNSV